MRNITTSIILITTIIIYFFSINVFALFILSTPEESIQEVKSKNQISEISVGDTTSVTLERNRWYGRIIENVGKETKVSYLYLFKIDFITIPLVIHNTNFKWIHFYFILLMALLFLILIDFSPSQKSQLPQINYMKGGDSKDAEMDKIPIHNSR